ncbi:MAG: tetratricopeptide repeat protein [Spirochaetales bacterium]|nr:MAG: tetratricopeptide repeat protein [Spirochaetales bacterium]
MPVIIVVIIIGVLVFVFLRILRKKNKSDDGNKGDDRNTVIREANRRLSQNPKDASALFSLAELYFKEENYDKAMKTYQVLIDLCSTNADLIEFDLTVRYAVSALKLKKFDAAYRSFLLARTMRQDSFEVNYNLGTLEYLKKGYEKAFSLLTSANILQPEHIPTRRYLGHCNFKLKKFREAADILRKVLDVEPGDKEALFILGQCYFELGQNDQAVKIFTRLRADPEIGPTAALYSGTIHLNSRQYAQAAEDFELGLRHAGIKKETALEIKYRLAAASIKQQDLGKAVSLLMEINGEVPGYKDTTGLLGRYRELNANHNLQSFLMASPSEFANLCRKIVEGYFQGSTVKITDISMNKNDYLDVLANVSTSRWDDVILYRFIRTTGQVGELYLRDLYARIRDVKAGRGFCIIAGEFSDGAKQFVEARLIDLVEKEALLKLLRGLSQREN